MITARMREARARRHKGHCTPWEHTHRNTGQRLGQQWHAATESCSDTKASSDDMEMTCRPQTLPERMPDKLGHYGGIPQETLCEHPLTNNSNGVNYCGPRQSLSVRDLCRGMLCGHMV